MRCPKCGYTSFDHLETCKKCQKYLGDVMAEINGTTYDAAPPLFLTITTMERSAASQPASQVEVQETSPLPDKGQAFELDEDGDKEFLLGQNFDRAAEQDGIVFPGSDSDLALELDALAEVSPRDEFTLDLDRPFEEASPPLPSMDFGELDISDLAPPAKEQAEPIRFAEQPILSDLEPVATLSSTTPPSPPKPAKSQPGLEDLNFNGLDLETPAKLVSGSAAGKRFLPSVKTGTALDKFDIDLGELFTDNKK